MLIRFSLKHIRSLKFRFFGAFLCLSVALGAFSGIHGVSRTLQNLLNSELTETAGGDLELSSPQPLTSEAIAELKTLGTFQQTTELVEFVTMARLKRGSHTRTQVVEVRAVDSQFPVAGTYSFEPAGMAFPPRPDGMIVHSDLIAILDISVGDWIELGETRLRIDGIVTREPSIAGSAFALGPRVWISKSALTQSGLVQFGSRVRYRWFGRLKEATRLQDDALTAYRKTLPLSLTIKTARESNTNLKVFFERLDLAFLVFVWVMVGLAALVLFSTLRVHATLETSTIRILSELGTSRRRLLMSFGFQMLLVLTAAWVMGSALGLLGHQILLPALSDWVRLPPKVPLPFGSVLLSFLLGVLLTLSATLTELAPIVYPDRRRTMRALGACLGLGGLFVFCPLWIALGLMGFTLILALGAFIVLKLSVALERLTPDRLSAIRYGLRTLSRHPARVGVLFSVFGSTLGVVMLILTLQASFENEIIGGADTEARPELFAIDLKTNQIQDVESWVSRAPRKMKVIQWSRWVRARLVSLNGKPPVKDDTEDFRLRSREINISERETLYPSERLESGEFWPESAPASDTQWVSLEKAYADRLKANVGDEIVIDIQGVQLALRVANIRRVRWATFLPNFFILLKSPALREAPSTWIAALDSESNEAARMQSEFSSAFPNATVFNVRQTLEQVLQLSQSLTKIIQLLALLCVVCGVLILATLLRFARLVFVEEARTLSLLGAQRAWIYAAQRTEWFASAALALGVASFGGCVGGALLMKFGVGITPIIDWSASLAIAVCAAAFFLGLTEWNLRRAESGRSSPALTSRER